MRPETPRSVDHCAWGCGAVIANAANRRRHEEAHARRLHRDLELASTTMAEAVQALTNMMKSVASLADGADSGSDGGSDDQQEVENRA
jgi:hypothetical protein